MDPTRQSPRTLSETRVSRKTPCWSGRARVVEFSLYHCDRRQESVNAEISSRRESFARDVSSFCDQHDWGGGDRSQTRQLADSSPDCRRLSRDCQLLETGDLCDVGSVYYLDSKKLSYRRGTARCVVSAEILPVATQQCRNYLYDKS